MVNQEKVRIAGIATESVVDGPGIRNTIFFQGCPHACPGCHNPETWRFDGGEEISLTDLYRLLDLNPLVTGVTFSGGEPFQQAPLVAVLGNHLRMSGLSVWVYTGFTWEFLMANLDRPGYKELLEVAEVLIDGPFIQEQRDLSLLFRGSTNQRLIKVTESMASGRIVLWQPPGMDVGYGMG
ncbi:MAG: anaerobic ribonucleoside-triphosphate reductase activating protein [Bacteroidota bacterium]